MNIREPKSGRTIDVVVRLLGCFPYRLLDPRILESETRRGHWRVFESANQAY